MLRDTYQFYLSNNHVQHIIAVNQCYSLLYLRYKLAKVRSFIPSLIHLGTRPLPPNSHSIMPGRENGNFTCLGFVRGRLIGWLY